MKNKNDMSNYISITVGSMIVAAILAIGLYYYFGNTVNVSDLLEQAISQEKLGYPYSDDHEEEGAEMYNYFADNDYNAIVELNDRGTTVYSFRKNTDTPVGNGGFYFNYEIGRIKINPEDKNKCSCTYNFRASLENKPVNWFKCSEKSFIKSLPKIAKIKAEKFAALKETMDYERQADICGYYDEEVPEECKNLEERNWEEVNKLHDKQLSELRNAKLHKKQ